MRLRNHHDGTSGGDISSVGVDASVDEEAKVQPKDEASDDGSTENLAARIGIPVWITTVTATYCVQVPVAVGVSIGAAVFIIILVGIQSDVCAEYAAHDAGKHPEDEAHADMRARVNTLFEFPDSSRNHFSKTPQHRNTGL